MIKNFIFKEIAIVMISLFLAFAISCGTKDNKNAAEPYPSSDTNKVEHKNDDMRHDSTRNDMP